MTRKLNQILLAASVVLMAMLPQQSQANLQLTFAVTNVVQNDCSGQLQPVCTSQSAASFTETLRLGSLPRAPATNNSFNTVFQTGTVLDFPFWSSATPFTSGLRSRVTGPITGTDSSSQLDNIYDASSAIGVSSASLFYQIQSDGLSDATGFFQQTYRRSYLLSNFFSDPNLYTDLTTDSIDTFFSKLIGVTYSGGFEELGSSVIQNVSTLNFDSYLFTEFTGDIQLIAADVFSVPEPDALSLALVAFYAAGAVRFQRSRFGGGRAAQRADLT